MVLLSGAGIATVLWAGRQMSWGLMLGKDKHFPATIVFFLLLASTTNETLKVSDVSEELIAPFFEAVSDRNVRQYF
jgi:hypothetical protein